MLPVYKRMENYAGGSDELRGRSGSRDALGRVRDERVRVHQLSGEQLLEASVPLAKIPVVEMELAIPGVTDGPPLVDQDEARPVADAICIPGAAVVVLRIRIRYPLAAERPGEVSLVMLTGVRWEFRRMNADDREPTLSIAAVVLHERRHRARAIAAGEHPEIEQHYSPAHIRKPQRSIGVEPARIGELGRRRCGSAPDRRPERRGDARLSRPGRRGRDGARRRSVARVCRHRR